MSTPTLTIPPLSPPAPTSPAVSPTPTPTPTSSPPTSTSSTSTSTSSTSSSEITSSSASSSSAPPSSTSTLSSSSSTSLSSSSSSSSSSAPTSAPPSSSPLSSAPSSQSVSTNFHVGTSNGIIFTETSIATIGGPTASADPSNRSGSGGFFHNKGAVAGVFTVVGVIAAVIAVVLITAAVRRRRAKKFDEEIDEAAAEAAAAHGPDFDDYDYTSGNTGYGGYSDGSHGTFAQPPMSHTGEAYRMNEIPPQNYYSDAASTAGAAGIGAAVGAAAMQRARSSRRDTQDPYLKFGASGAPDPAQYEPQDSTLRYRGNVAGENPSFDILEAAGLGGVSGGDPYAIARGPSQRSMGGMPGPYEQGVSRNHSLSGPEALSSDSHYSGGSAPMPMPPQQPFAPYQAQYANYPQQAPYDAPYADVPPPPPPPPEASPYDGYLDASPIMPNPHSPAPPDIPRAASPDSEELPPPAGHAPHHDHEDSQDDDEDDDDDGYDSGRRVLRVANE